MLDYIAYILIRIVNVIFRVIPITACLWLARRIGSTAFLVNKKRRLVAYANLKAAFAGEKPPAELKRITKKVYQSLLQTVIEILNLTKVDKAYINKYVEVVNLDRIENASKSGRGTILLTAHFGDWELSSLTSAMHGFPILVLVREQKMKRVNELLNQIRESKGCKVVRKGMSTKNILRALYGKSMIGILADQDAGRNGIFVSFFGRATSNHSGAMEMAKRTDSIVLPNFIVRVKGPYHKLFLEEYIDFRNSKSDDDVREGLQKYANLLETYVRKYPDQWLWLHKRWKSTPARTVLVLSDGKAGHLNQSLAVAFEIRQARMTQGYKYEDTKIVVIDIKFRNRFSRAALGLCATFATWRCHGCMRCMKASLTDGVYKTLMGTYAEFIVSCGSSLEGVNVLMSKENDAKNIIVMKPSFGLLHQYNLAVIPRHDRPPERRNIVSTMIAPNLIDEKKLAKDGEALRKRFGITGDNFIGLFIGGDNPEFEMRDEIIDEALDGLIEFCKRANSRMLVTTSRRTPRSIEELLKKRLGSDPVCGLLIIANEDNPEGAVSGILGMSRVSVVSGESVSMISEALSSGKKAIVLEITKKKNYFTKHERALEGLKRYGYIRLAKAEALPAVVEEAWNDKRKTGVPGDREKIFEAVRRLI